MWGCTRCIELNLATHPQHQRRWGEVMPADTEGKYRPFVRLMRQWLESKERTMYISPALNPLDAPSTLHPQIQNIAYHFLETHQTPRQSYVDLIRRRKGPVQHHYPLSTTSKYLRLH